MFWSFLCIAVGYVKLVEVYFFPFLAAAFFAGAAATGEAAATTAAGAGEAACGLNS